MGEIRVANVTKFYGGERRADVKALDCVSLRWQEGESLALMGGSGSGKSTLARLILGLERPDTGDIRLDGISLAGSASGRGALTGRCCRAYFRMHPAR